MQTETMRIQQKNADINVIILWKYKKKTEKNEINLQFWKKKYSMADVVADDRGVFVGNCNAIVHVRRAVECKFEYKRMSSTRSM